MSRPGTSRARTTTAIRFPPQLHERLAAAADEHDRSINWLVVKAVEDFLPRLVPAAELRLTRDHLAADVAPTPSTSTGEPTP